MGGNKNETIGFEKATKN